MKNFLSLILIILVISTVNVYAKNDRIKSSEANEFLRQGFLYAVELYGGAQVKVNKVVLRHSNRQAQTELTDENNGTFTIYLTRNPSEYAFYGQLAHEVAHLLNAKLYDAYVEGLNGVFTEKLLTRSGKDWSGWEKFYREGGDPFYAATYFMMKEVEKIAGQTAMKSFLSHAKYSDNRKKRMYIDIDSWLFSLPKNNRTKIRNIIHKHSTKVIKSMSSVEQVGGFKLPE